MSDILLRERRRERGLTQTELAELVGTDQATISLIETKQRKPSLPLAVRIEEVLAIPVESWVDAPQADEGARACA